MDPTELYMLGLGVLNHEPDVHKILADVLEEQGELGMAQWARAKKTSRQKRLDFVIAILPPKLALDLACSFSERVLELRPKDRRRWPNRNIEKMQPKVSDLTQLIGSIRQMFTKGVSTDTVFTPLIDWSRIAYYGSFADEIGLLQSLHLAATSLMRAEEYRAADEHRDERKQATECRNAVRNVGKLARLLVAKYELRVNRGTTLIRTELADYQNWQHQHLQKTLTELIERRDE